MSFVDNTEKHRFELEVEGKIAFISYRSANNVYTLLHTEVPAELSGKGVGSRLVHAVLQELSARHAQVIPQCEFVAAYLKRHPEEA